MPEWIIKCNQQLFKTMQHKVLIVRELLLLSTWIAIYGIAATVYIHYALNLIFFRLNFFYEIKIFFYVNVNFYKLFYILRYLRFMDIVFMYLHTCLWLNAKHIHAILTNYYIIIKFFLFLSFWRKCVKQTRF